MSSMTKERADIVIVGARCAGSTLACHLARAGARVVVLDRDALPSEHVLSTHTLHPAGVRVVDALGLGEALRRSAPAMRRFRLRKDEATLQLDLSTERAEYCPRRARFDGLLQGAAREAGADVRERTRVTGLLYDGDRVAGVRAVDRTGAAREIRAALVVGADGRGSTIADETGAEEYLGYDAPRAMYWGYFPTPGGYEPIMDIAYDRTSIRVAFATEDEQVLVGFLPHVEQAKAFAGAPLEALREALLPYPEFAALVRAEPSEPVRGIVKTRYFFRRAVGSGWALVGDAALHKEFVSGDGMSEALVQATRLARAIGEGTESALLCYWHQRDVDALPRFFFYKAQGAKGARSRFEVFALARLGNDPRLLQRLALTLEHELSPFDVVPPAVALRWLMLALVRGRFAMVPEFLAMGKSAAEAQRMVAAARRNLAAVRGSEAVDLPNEEALSGTPRRTVAPIPTR